NTLLRHFGVATLDGFGVRQEIRQMPHVAAAGALFKHLRDQLMIPLDHVKSLSLLHAGQQMLLDRATLQNLELLEPIHEGKEEQTLLYCIDKTKTPMGGRQIAEWLKAPLLDVAAIQARQDAVEELLGQT